jgi:cytochrome c-type biogenesis protein CcmH
MRPGLKSALLALLCWMLMAAPAAAVLPDEVLADPVLESRARDISSELRCMVCQNQSIDDSDAELARDLRVLVRERIAAGNTDAEVIDYLVSRYGEFVLLRPRFNARNALLWVAPALLLLGGGLFLLFSARGKRRETASTGKLSADEQATLREILRERG